MSTMFRKEKMTPEIKELPELDELREKIKDYIDYLQSDERHEDVDGDYEHAIYEAALEAFCGKDVWDFINSI